MTWSHLRTGKIYTGTPMMTMMKNFLDFSARDSVYCIVLVNLCQF